jgi:hypothetical protein
MENIIKYKNAIIENTGCNIHMLFNDIENNIENLYYVEYFINDINAFNEFMNNVTYINVYGNITSEKGRTITINVRSSGYISVYCKRRNRNINNKENIINKKYNYKTQIKLNIDLLNILYKLYNEFTNFKFMLYYYKDFPEEYKFINDENCFMIPDFGKFYSDANITKSIYNIITKYNNIINNKSYKNTKTNSEINLLYIKKSNNHYNILTPSEINLLYTIKYKLYVKDHNILTSDDDLTRVNKMRISDYRHIFYLNSSNLTKFKKIREAIHIFFYTCGINKDDLNIRIYFDEFKYKLKMITIDINLKNIKNNYYDVNKFESEYNSIMLDELINMLNICDKKKCIGSYLNNKYNIYLSEYVINTILNSKNDINIKKKLKEIINKNNKIHNYTPSNINKNSYKNFFRKFKNSNIFDNFKIVDKIEVMNTKLPLKNNKGEYSGNITEGYIIWCNESMKIDTNFIIKLENCNIDKSENYDNKLFSGYINGTIQIKRLLTSIKCFNNLLKDGKINSKLKVIRILSYNGTNKNYKCGASICCCIETTYYIVNIIPITPLYITNKLIEPQKILKYLLTSPHEKFINSSNYDYFSASYKHNYMYYTMEIINISPLTCGSCTYINDNLTLRQSTIMLKPTVHIKLEESYEGSTKIIECYKKNFFIAYFIFLMNIIRNLHFLKKNINTEQYNNTEIVTFKLIREIEYMYHNYEIDKETVPIKIYTDIIINAYINDNIIFSEKSDNPFICIKSLSYNENQPTTFKYIIWHTTAFNFHESDDQFIDIIHKLYNIYKNKKYTKNRKNKFDWSALDEKCIVYMYNTKKSFNITKFKNSYLYNISCLFVNEQIFKTIIEYINDIFNNLCIKINKTMDELYGLYHYPVVSTMNSLHIHIYNKLSAGSDSFSSVYRIGKWQHLVHEYTKYYYADYRLLIYEEWRSQHPYIMLVYCANKIKEKMNNYYVFYNGQNTLFINIILDLLLKKIIDDADYEIVSKFIIECTNNDDPSKNIIYNYIYDAYRDCSYDFYNSLLKYGNNFKTFMRYMYYIYT